MQFRDLKQQYQVLKSEMDQAIDEVLLESNFISGYQVLELEEELASFVGVKNCITCANGTDALTLALMTWNITEGDAVFVPNFTFFASGETVAFQGATPVFVDVEEDTFNMSSYSLEMAIRKVIENGRLMPKAIVAVDLFGQPANYIEICKIAKKYNLYLLEDGAQGFGGEIENKKACSFGDISTTSFFPAKPLGCYGDGGAIFTNNDEWADMIRSLRIHGKGNNKYDNIRIGMNSRLDTLQAAILRVKFKQFRKWELSAVNKVAELYNKELKDIVKVPIIKTNYYSSWAQYSILLKNEDERDKLKEYLGKKEIPTMVYYPKVMTEQDAFKGIDCCLVDLAVSNSLCKRVLALPIHPYLKREEQLFIIEAIKQFYDSYYCAKSDLKNI